MFDQEVEAITRLTRSRRKAATFAHDDLADWVNDLETSYAGIEELDAAFERLEAMDQYDEGGAILMSSYERTTARKFREYRSPKDFHGSGPSFAHDRRKIAPF